MSAKNKTTDIATKLERQLDRIEAQQRRQLKNEDILYFEKNGDIGCETVRTVSVPVTTIAAAAPPRAKLNEFEFVAK